MADEPIQRPEIENLGTYLRRLKPPLVFTVSPVDKESVPQFLFQRPSSKNVMWYSYAIALGDRHIDGYCFIGRSHQRPPEAWEIIANLQLNTGWKEGDKEYDEELVEHCKQQLHTLFTDEQIEALYETDY